MSNIDDYLRPTKYLCNVIGMWPETKGNRVLDLQRGFMIFRKLFSLVAIGNIIVPELLEIFKNRNDVALVTRVGCVLITVGLLGYKMIYLISNNGEFSQLYLYVRDFWEAGKFEKERKIYEKFALRAKIFTVVFFISGFGNNVTFTTAAVFDWVKQIRQRDNDSEIRRRLPFEVRYGFDIESSPNYEITFLCQTISAIFCCIGIVGLDSLMMTLVLHVSGQFALVKFWYSDIRRCFLSTKKNQQISTSHNLILGEKKHPSQYPRNGIIKCLRHHQKIIRAADQLENLLSPVIFAQFVTSGAEICLSGFAVTTGINEKMDMIRFTNYLISMTVQLFAWCMVGEILTRQSESIGDAVFHDLPWYEFPVNLQHDLVLVIKRSQKPCCLTAGKFQVMNVEKLGHVFSSAASYFALLRQTRME